MKNFIYAMIAVAAITACKKSTTSTSTSNGLFSGCFNTYYYYTYNSGTIDTNHITFISDDSLSYTNRSGGDPIIYCYKHMGDSISFRRYDGDLSHLTFNGTIFLNSKNLSARDFIYHSNGALNDSAFNTYDANGRLTEGISNYGSYRNDYTNFYDANGNKIYTIYKVSGLVNYRDSVVFTYDLSKESKMIYGYALGFLYGKPDKNLVTQALWYNSDADTLLQTTTYNNIVDGSGYLTQRNIHTVYAGSGTIYNTSEKYTTDCR